MNTNYYHGGFPGFRRGDVLLPPAVTGTTHTLSTWADALGAEPDATCRDFVYVTVGRDVARAYAALHPDGALYRVRPTGPLTPDPDCRTPGLSWRCAAAVVEAVVDPCVLARDRALHRWILILERGSS